MEFRFRAKSGNKTFDEPSYVQVPQDVYLVPLFSWYTADFDKRSRVLAADRSKYRNWIEIGASIQGRKGIVTLTPKYACYYIDET